MKNKEPTWHDVVGVDEVDNILPPTNKWPDHYKIEKRLKELTNLVNDVDISNLADTLADIESMTNELTYEVDSLIQMINVLEDQCDRLQTGIDERDSYILDNLSQEQKMELTRLIFDYRLRINGETNNTQ